MSLKACTCQMIECVCALVARHKATCRRRLALLCPVSIECEHGFDVCPVCDPCNCEGEGEGVDSEPLS